MELVTLIVAYALAGLLVNFALYYFTDTDIEEIFDEFPPSILILWVIWPAVLVYVIGKLANHLRDERRSKN